MSANTLRVYKSIYLHKHRRASRSDSRISFSRVPLSSDSVVFGDVLAAPKPFKLNVPERRRCVRRNEGCETAGGWPVTLCITPSRIVAHVIACFGVGTI